MRSLATALGCFLASIIVVDGAVGNEPDARPAPERPRVWTDATGQYRLEATLVGVTDGKVRLCRKDGATVNVPLHRLSDADRRYVVSRCGIGDDEQQAAAAGEASAKPANAAHPPRDLTLKEVNAQVRGACVRIECDNHSMGSGFFIDRNIVSTNFHVVEGAGQAAVVLEDKTRLAVRGFLACAPRKDIALLRVDWPADPADENHTPLRLANTPPEQLDEILVIGSPLGLDQTVVDGTVNAVRTFGELMQTDPRLQVLDFENDLVLVQISAPVSHGNSGGPVVNLRGEVVGMATLMRPEGQNVNFAIAAKEIAALFAQHRESQVQPLANLPRRRLLAPLIRPVPGLDEGQDEILWGSTPVRPEAFVIPDRDLRDFFRRTLRLQTQVQGIGLVEAGIVTRAGPTTFGLPDGFAFLQHPSSKTVTVFEGVTTKYGFINTCSKGQVHVDRLVGIIGFSRGDLNGHVHLFERWPMYYGEWLGGRPRPYSDCLLRFEERMFVLMRRAPQPSKMIIAQAGRVVSSFETPEQIAADENGMKMLQAFEQRERNLKQMASEIAKAVQDQAKAIQAELVARKAVATREAIAARINQRRDENEAALMKNVSDAVRRSTP